jgi:putative sterol carrier protein
MNEPPVIDTSKVDADEFARNLGSVADGQLAGAMSGPMRARILDEIFERMERHFAGAKDVDAVIHWRIGDAPEGGHDEFETVIRDGTCRAHRGLETESARVTFTIGGAHFLRLVTGNAAGPTLFLTGKLKIKGDMMFAASTASLFRIPNA